VPWRLAHALGDEAPQARWDTADDMRRVLLDRAAELKEITQDLDAVTAVMYLDNLPSGKLQGQVDMAGWPLGGRC
jgi:hypothetical protein